MASATLQVVGRMEGYAMSTGPETVCKLCQPFVRTPNPDSSGFRLIPSSFNHLGLPQHVGFFQYRNYVGPR